MNVPVRLHTSRDKTTTKESTVVQHINMGSLGKTYEDVEDAGTCTIEGCEKDLPSDDVGGVCWNHAMAIYARVAHIRDMAPDGAPRFRPIPEHEPLVYYVRLGDYVKIGTTTGLTRRLEAFRMTVPGLKLLATEPGGFDVERERHGQFASHRVPRSELFKPHRELGEHINELRQKAAA